MFSVSASAVYNHYLKFLSFLNFFSNLREGRLYGWDGHHWEGKTGIEDLKDERRWHLLKDEEELSLEYECIIQLKLCM